MNKQTAEPWRVISEKHQLYDGLVVSADNRLVAAFCDDNGSLIAAAPELLEAAKGVVESWLESPGKWSAAKSDYEDLRDLRNAIAKAEGAEDA